MIADFTQLLDAVNDLPMRTVAVAVAEKESILDALKEAMRLNVARPLLVGCRARIEAAAEAAGLVLDDIETIDVSDDLLAAAEAARAVHEGRADILMKGHIQTDDFLRAVLDKEHGLRTGAIMSHVFVLETTARAKLTFVTDGAMNIEPDLATKADIILNAVYLARCFGIACPKVGVLAAVEVVNPAMPATVDAAALTVMQSRGQFPDCMIEGPLALDNAVCLEAARLKGLQGGIAGDCDILVAPDIEAGNILSKSFAFLAGGRSAGVLVGAAAPVVLTSRADTAEAKLYSIAVAVLMANLVRSDRLKIGKVHF